MHGEQRTIELARLQSFCNVQSPRAEGVVRLGLFGEAGYFQLSELARRGLHHGEAQLIVPDGVLATLDIHLRTLIGTWEDVSVPSTPSALTERAPFREIWQNTSCL